ncbi:MAG: hypothetical protein HC868_06970 [Sphingomonadales bacterium]|nr:hypothetical protein [Sphingomonadales bacterium]
MLSQLYFSLIAASAVLPFAMAGATMASTAANRISSPTVHENIAVYFVHGTSAAGPVPATLQEALARGDVEVFETGNVRELEIENKGTEPVFVQFGDLVKGGKQDRVLTVSLVLSPKSGRVPIGSYCVEQGRWSARGGEDAKKFSMSDRLMPSREAKIAMARPKAEPSPQALMVDRLNAARRSEEQRYAAQERRAAPDGQSEVWRSVGAVQSALSSHVAAPVASEKSRTSLQLALENDKLKDAMGKYINALEPAGLKGDDIVGVVIAVNGRISSADMYPSNGLFRKMWPKLVRAGVTEAMANKAAKADAAPAPAEVDTFLNDAEKGKQSELALGSHAKLETRDADKALRMEARSASGAFVHRNYLAK